MSTTRITTVKIVGRLGAVIRQLFQDWVEEKIGELRHEPLHSVLQLDKTNSVKILSLSKLLGDHSDFPSVVWFHEYVDTWTIAPSHFAIGDLENLSTQIKIIQSDNVEAMLITASDRKVARCLKERIINYHNVRGHSPERRYFLNQLRRCAISWQPFLETNNIETTLLVVFDVIGPSRLDHDIIRMAENLPVWFQQAIGSEQTLPRKRGGDLE